MRSTFIGATAAHLAFGQDWQGPVRIDWLSEMEGARIVAEHHRVPVSCCRCRATFTHFVVWRAHDGIWRYEPGEVGCHNPPCVD